MEPIVPVGVGIILSVILAYLQHRDKSVSRWMTSRRIDSAKPKPKNACGVCGAPMVKRRSQNGPYAGKYVMVCSKYPECRKVDWHAATDY